jgi:siroheme synthase
VTHRHVAASFTVLTGHENPDSDANPIDYEALVRLGGTLVLLMGVHHLPRIVEHLLAAGLAPETPAVTIEWGTTDHQRTVRATVATIAARAAHLQPPATTVIGAVAGLDLAWFMPEQ